jgi:hypothetical protein
MNSLVLAAALTSAPAHPPQLPPPPIFPQPIVVPQPVVIAPAVRIQPQVVPVAVPVVVPQPVPVLRPPFPVPQPPVPAAISLADFSRVFTPTPGKHHVWVIHPVTRQPVEVCFTLPPGQLREFKVDRREIRFEFRGGYEVEIEFRHNGTVRVRYDN